MAEMDWYYAMNGSDPNDNDLLGTKHPRETLIQILFSLALGISAFLGFCILRPRWSDLYAARKNQRDEATPLPDLPPTMFGWIPKLWRVTDQQVLASAGLDAYVFLRFFKMAIKFLCFTLFFALVVIKPVHDAFPEDDDDDDDGSKGGPNNSTNGTALLLVQRAITELSKNGSSDGPDYWQHISTDYLWMYLIFSYIFTGLALWLLKRETEAVIEIRQEYLGCQSTITDRTIRLSGIPMAYRSEDKIREFIEALHIGKVDSVMLCRNWHKLDTAMDERQRVVRKLETAWVLFLGESRNQKADSVLPTTQQDAAPYTDEENQDSPEDVLHVAGNGRTSEPRSRARPRKTIRYGLLKLKSYTVDEIEHYEEKLRRVDDEIVELRKREFEPEPLAFVTMDTVAACQMATQAVLDPSPMKFIAKGSPAPKDVVWRNTYIPRKQRMAKAWTITLVITVLTIFWSLVLIPIATILNVGSLHKIFPQFAHWLSQHSFATSLVQTQLPTLLTTLLFVAVPYLYDWLANQQGIISQSEVEMSVISKNFFFTFFNYFVVFTVLGTFSNFWGFWDHFQDSLKDTTRIAYTLATSLARLQSYYTNLIILQGLGLLPFRLLEFGAVFLYPFYRYWAKTPRDYAELRQPPTFLYGFFLPQVLLIFLICVVYSILRDSWQVILAGLLYFCIGGFVYKYQLLYAMDHRQHSTGRAWIFICNRIIVGLILFQLTTTGQLALKNAFRRSAAVVPLIIITAWYWYTYNRHYMPLMRYIALKSIERNTAYDASPTPYLDEPEPELIGSEQPLGSTIETPGDDQQDVNVWGDESSPPVQVLDGARLRYQTETRPGHTVDESEESGNRFVNPSLVLPLDPVWISNDEQRQLDFASGAGRRRMEAAITAAT